MLAFCNATARKAIALSAATLSLVLTSQVAFAGKANFRIVNDTNVTVRELYISDSSRDNWDNDILGRNVLPSGNSIQVVFGDMSPRTCLYDIRAVFADGQVFEDYRINVCTNDYYTLFEN